MAPAKDDDLIVERLAMVAHFQSFAAHSLAIGSVIDIGRPGSRIGRTIRRTGRR